MLHPHKTAYCGTTHVPRGQTLRQHTACRENRTLDPISSSPTTPTTPIQRTGVRWTTKTEPATTLESDIAPSRAKSHLTPRRGTISPTHGKATHNLTNLPPPYCPVKTAKLLALLGIILYCSQDPTSADKTPASLALKRTHAHPPAPLSFQQHTLTHKHEKDV